MDLSVKLVTWWDQAEGVVACRDGEVWRRDSGGRVLRIGQCVF